MRECGYVESGSRQKKRIRGPMVRRKKRCTQTKLKMGEIIIINKINQIIINKKRGNCILLSERKFEKECLS